MPIPQSEIAALKKSIDLPALLRSQGHTMRPRGKDLATRCPFHEEENPSLLLSEKAEGWLWHCFGCNKGGDVFTWLMEREGVEFRVAYEMLENGYISGDFETSKFMANPFSKDMSDHALLKRAVDYYHQSLLNSDSAKPLGICFFARSFKNRILSSKTLFVK